MNHFSRAKGARRRLDNANGKAALPLKPEERSALLTPQVIELSRRAAEHRAQSLLKELEEELTELRRRSTALSQLTLSEDYVHFLKVDGSELLLSAD